MKEPKGPETDLKPHRWGRLIDPLLPEWGLAKPKRNCTRTGSALYVIGRQWIGVKCKYRESVARLQKPHVLLTHDPKQGPLSGRQND